MKLLLLQFIAFYPLQGWLNSLIYRLLLWLYNTLKRHGFPNIIDTEKCLEVLTTLELNKQQNLLNSRVLLFSYRRRSGSLMVYVVLLKSYLRNPHQRNRVFLRCMNKYFLRPDFLFTTEVQGIVECKETFLSARRWNPGIEVVQWYMKLLWLFVTYALKLHLINNQPETTRISLLLRCPGDELIVQRGNFRYLFKLRIIFPNSYTPSKNFKLL